MRWKWILGICICFIMALMAAVYIFLRTYDYSKLKPRLTQMVGETTGRELNLGGKIKLTIGFSPVLVATDITFGNAAWGSQPQMLKIDELRAQIRLLPLLVRKVELRHFVLKGVDILLETNPDGQGNWDFPTRSISAESFGAFEPTEIAAGDIRFEDLDLTFRDGKTGSATRFNLADFKMARRGADDGLAVDLKADYKGKRLTLSGKTGSVDELLESKRFPLELSGTFADATIKLQGAVDDLIAISGIDFQFKGTGKDLAKIGALIDQKLPSTDEFALEGRLTGSVKALRLQSVKGRARRGDLSMEVDGGVEDLIALNGLDLNVHVLGNDFASLGAIIEQKLPATDEFSIQGRLTGTAKDLSLKQAQGSAKRGSLKVDLSGAIKNLIAFSGVDLNFKGSGKDLAEIGTLVDLKLPATDQFAVQARLTGSTQALSLQGIRGSVSRDSLNLTASGGIKALLALEGINFTLKATGKELAEIGPLVGTDLPELGPFSSSARLSGSAKTISLKPFSLIVDQSDFNGLARVEFLKRPKITLRLESSVIDFTTLMKSLEKDSQKPVKKDNQKRHLFSDDSLPFDVLKKIDADIVLKAKNIDARNARLKFGFLTLMLEDGDFSIDRLEAAYKETKISGNLNVNSSSPPQLTASFLVQDLDLGNLLKDTGVSNQVRAHVDIAAHGKSSGYSVQGLMAGLDGSIGAVMGKGYLSNYLNLISFNLAHKVREFWGRHEKGDQIKCAVVQFDINKGIADSRAFVFDTQAGILEGEGEINLGTEKVNFILVPKPTSPSLSFATKLRVTGTILDAKVKPDKLALAKEGSKLLSTLVIGPLGLLAPFVRLGAHKKHPCVVKSLGELGLSVPAKK